MTITKISKIDQITVEGNGIVLYREATSIMEDKIELSKSYKRFSLTPAQDLTDVPKNVADICNLTWTPEVIAEYNAELDSIKKNEEIK